MDTTLISESDAPSDIAATPAYHTCYSNNADFRKMLTTFWPCIEKFMHEHPTHEHTKQWQTWINQGLHQHSDLAFVKNILQMDTLDQLFLFFRDSPAIQMGFNIYWDHKINYQSKTVVTVAEITPITTNVNKYMVYLLSLDIEFPVFHQKVFKLIQKWSTTIESKSHPSLLLWKKWLWKGLTQSSTLNQIKHILEILDIAAYMESIFTYPPISDYVDVEWHANHTAFDYKISYSATDDDISLPTLTSATESSSNHFQYNVDHLKQIHEVKMDNINRTAVDLEAKMLSCEHMVKTHFATYKTKLQQVTTDMMEDIMQSLKTIMGTIVNKTIQQLDAAIQAKVVEFEGVLNTTVGEVIQDVYISAKAAHNAMNNRIDDVLYKMDEQVRMCNGVMEAIKEFHKQVPDIIALNKVIAEFNKTHQIQTTEKPIPQSMATY